MRTPEQRRTLRTLGYAGIAYAMIAALAMIASGCTASKGATNEAQPNIMQLGFEQAKRYAIEQLKNTRLAISATNTAAGLCLEFGFASADGTIFVGTSAAALFQVQSPCIPLGDVKGVPLVIGVPAMPVPVTDEPKTFPLRVIAVRQLVDSVEADTAEAAPDTLTREGNGPVKGE